MNSIDHRLIYHATHFDLPYVKEVYADKLFIVNVGENGVVDTMNKEQLMAFIQHRLSKNHR